MNKSGVVGSLVAVIIFLTVVVLSNSIYTVNDGEQVIITQFGKPKRIPVTTAGLKFKAPFIQEVNRFEKGNLEWDCPTYETRTKDKTHIIVTTYGRCQITDLLMYFHRLGDERRAMSRMNDIIGSETRKTIANYELIEVIRTTKDRVPQQADDFVEADLTGTVGTLPEISRSRTVLEEEIFAKSREKLEVFGIELLDFRFKRVQLQHPSDPGSR